MFFRQPEHIADGGHHWVAEWAESLHPTGLRRVPGREYQAGRDQTAAEETFHKISRVPSFSEQSRQLL